MSINALLDGPVVWPLVGFTATTCYLLVIAVQFWVATHRGDDADAIGPLGNREPGEIEDGESPPSEPGAAQKTSCVHRGPAACTAGPWTASVMTAALTRGGGP